MARLVLTEIRNSLNRPHPVTGNDRPAIVDRRNTVKQWAASVQQAQMFSDIPVADSTLIVGNAQERNFGRRQTIFLGGEPARHVYLMLSGCLKLSQLGASGQEVILRLSGPGDVLGALGKATENSCEARTLQPSSALVWSRSDFQVLLERFPLLRSNIAGVLEGHINELDVRFREVSTQKVGPRLSSQLVRLSKQVGRQVDGHFEISLSRRELAQLTGTTLFTVSRLLSRWEAQGFLRARREAVLVRDLPGLLELSSEE